MIMTTIILISPNVGIAKNPNCELNIQMTRLLSSLETRRCELCLFAQLSQNLLGRKCFCSSVNVMHGRSELRNTIGVRLPCGCNDMKCYEDQFCGWSEASP